MKKRVINLIQIAELGVEGLFQQASESNWNWLHKDPSSWGITFNRQTLAWWINTPEFCRRLPNDVWTLKSVSCHSVCNTMALYCVWKYVESRIHFTCLQCRKNSSKKAWWETTTWLKERTELPKCWCACYITSPLMWCLGACDITCLSINWFMV